MTNNGFQAFGLVKAYNGKRVVDHVDMTLERGRIVGLLGPNGAGKTTSFYMMVGLARPDEGRVLLDGADVTRDPMYLRARKGINYLAQEPSVFRKLTVEENLLAILETLKITRQERQERLKTAPQRIEYRASRQAEGIVPVGWRKAEGRNHPGTGDGAPLHASRRTVCRD